MNFCFRPRVIIRRSPNCYRRSLALAAALALVAGAGGAQAGGCTVGTSAVTCVPARTTAPYRSVDIGDESASASIACTDDGSTPALNAAGSYTIGPLAARHWGQANTVYSGPFKCVGSGAGTPVTFSAE